MEKVTHTTENVVYVIWSKELGYDMRKVYKNKEVAELVLKHDFSKPWTSKNAEIREIPAVGLSKVEQELMVLKYKLQFEKIANK